jgi:hypothetical protein
MLRWKNRPFAIALLTGAIVGLPGTHAARAFAVELVAVMAQGRALAAAFLRLCPRTAKSTTECRN